METEEILQEPNTGNAVNGWDVEGDAANLLVGKVEEADGDFRLIEVGPCRPVGNPLTPDTGMWLEIVKLFQSIFGEQLVDKKTTLTTKEFVSFGDESGWTQLAAMEAAAVRTGVGLRGRSHDGIFSYWHNKPFWRFNEPLQAMVQPNRPSPGALA